VERLQGRTCQRRKVRTTHSDHDGPIAPNLLLDRPAPSKTDEVWVADITYVPRRGLILHVLHPFPGLSRGLESKFALRDGKMKSPLERLRRQLGRLIFECWPIEWPI